MYHICESLKVMGFQAEGAAQEYVALDAANVLKIPDGVLLDHAAMVEPISVGVHAIARGGGVDGKKVLVLGAGPIGNLAAQVARASGAEAVMITDVSDYKLSKAKECGLEMAINPNKGDLSEAILNSFGPNQADLILECVGVQAAITQAVECARKGTSIIIVGVFGQKPVVDLCLVQDRELSLVGSLMYQKPDYEQAIKLVAGGKLVLTPLITDHFPFEQYLEAYQKIEATQGSIMKVVITLD
jgi:L-iditol 2-dehydrogenase